MSAQETIQAYHANTWKRHHVFILCKYPKDALALVKGGISIDSVNVGNVGGMTQHKDGSSKQIFKSIAVNHEDREVFQELLDTGVDLEVRVVPGDRRMDLERLLEKS